MIKLFLFLIITIQLHAFLGIKPLNINEKKGINGNLGLSAKYSQGNTDKKQINLSADTKYYAKDKIYFILVNYSFGESNSVRDTNKGLVHLRYLKKLNSIFDYEIFSQVEFNEFQDLKLRSVTGVNLRNKVNLFKSFYIGYGLMYSYMKPKEITYFNKIRKDIVANLYLSMTEDITKNLNFNYLGYYQPIINNLNDFRVSQVFQFDNKINKKFMIRVEAIYQYNESPYYGIEKEDFSTNIGLIYRF